MENGISIARHYIQLWIILLVSVGIHEFAHAYTSYKLWDPTPKIQGRLTPSPLKHIDIVGFFMIFLIWFWRGKPVQIDPSYYKNRYRDELLTAIAWPISNIILGIIWILIIFIYGGIGNFSAGELFTSNNLVLNFWMFFSVINFGLATFNMIPLPPLDGYRIIKFLTPKIGLRMEKNMMYIGLGFLLIMILGPGSNLLWSYIGNVSYGLFRFFAFPLSQLFY